MFFFSFFSPLHLFKGVKLYLRVICTKLLSTEVSLSSQDSLFTSVEAGSAIQVYTEVYMRIFFFFFTLSNLLGLASVF